MIWDINTILLTTGTENKCSKERNCSPHFQKCISPSLEPEQYKLHYLLFTYFSIS